MIGGHLPVLTDPDGARPIVAAGEWVRLLLTGTPATVVATLAVAGIGFLMLQGRLPLRRGASVILGCFVIFGASAIAQGLLALGHAAAGEASVAAVSPVVPDVPPPAPPPPPQPNVYDPYAGASVPVR